MSDFDAYHKWLGISPDDQPPHYYRLLGISLFEKDRTVIISALDQRQSFLKQKSVGAQGELAEPLLSELQQARLCLLNRLTKAQYDSTLREQRLAAPSDPPAPHAAAPETHSSGHGAKSQSPAPRPSRSAQIEEQPQLAAPANEFQFPTERDLEDVSINVKRGERRSRRISWTINVLVVGALAGGIWWLIGKGILPPPGELLDPPKHQRVVDKVDELTDPDSANTSNRETPTKTIKPEENTATTSSRPQPTSNETKPPAVANDLPPAKSPTAIKPSIRVPQGTNEQRFADHRATVGDFSLSADGKLLATAGPAGDCRVWNVATGKTSIQFSGHDGQVHSVAFAPKGNQVFSSAETLKFWNLSTGKELAELKTNRRPVRAVLFWPNNRQLATVGGGAIEIWDVATRKQVRLISGVHPFCGSLALSEDGLMLAATTGEQAEEATLFLPTTGKTIRSFVGHKSRISSLALSKDGQSLWTASEEHVARLWKTKTGTSAIVFAHADVLALSPDEKLLATGGLNGIVSIWNAQTGSGLLQLPRQKLRVLDISFLPDGEHLLIAGDSSDTSGKTATIQLWKLPKIDPNSPGSRPNSMPVADATEDEPPANSKDGDAVLQKQPVPKDDQREQSETNVKEIFKQDFAKALRLADKAALAEKLLEHAKTTVDDPSGKYALLQEASHSAVAAGDIDVAEKILNELIAHFDVDAVDSRSKTYKQLSTTVKSGAPQEQLANAFLKLAAECATASRFDTAMESTKTAVLLAGKAKNLKLRETAKAKTDEYLLKKQSADMAEQFRESLSKNPNDSVANEGLGKYLCFVKDDWPAGLPHLAKSDNQQLRSAAELEQTELDSATKMNELGDCWWELAKKFTGVEKTGANRRAQFWYLQAIPELKGLDKVRTKTRLDELEKLKLDRDQPDGK